MLSGLAALGLAAPMACATITNTFVIHTSLVAPLAFLVISAVIAWGRRPHTKALAARLQR